MQTKYIFNRRLQAEQLEERWRDCSVVNDRWCNPGRVTVKEGL